ncbi:hypothetical protein CsatB_019973 [Cannabis sativa]
MTMKWANMPGSGFAHLLTPFKVLSSVRFSFRMYHSGSRVYFLISVLALLNLQ